MNHLLAELKAKLEQHQAEEKALHLFFRDDDVDEDEESLRHLLHLFLRHEVPVNLGVIPGRLTNSAIGLLAPNHHTFSHLIELNQHGWQHINHEWTGKKCEFGTSRTFSEQLKDIAKGKAKMTESFGHHWFPVFIPPWNRCTAETYRALDQLGFLVLSQKRGAFPVSGYQFREISITLDLYRWQGGVALRPLEEILRDLIWQIEHLTPVGIMLHHKIMADEAFSFLALLLETLSQYSVIRYHTFQSILRITDC